MRARCLLFCMFILFVIGISADPGYAKIDPGTAVGIWLFDEDSGDTAGDSSRQANHGTLMNGPERVDGKLGKALSFNGANHVEVADSESLDIADAVTIVAWVYRRTSQTGWRVLVSREKGTGLEEHYFLGLSGSAARWFVHTQESEYSDTEIGPTVPNGEWIHMAGTYDGSDVILYINGQKEFTTSHSGVFTDDVNPVVMGAGTNNSGVSFVEHFDGIIDEVAIFDVALSESDIKAIMSQGLDSVRAVSASGKLATTWAGIRAPRLAKK